MAGSREERSYSYSAVASGRPPRPGRAAGFNPCTAGPTPTHVGSTLSSDFPALRNSKVFPLWKGDSRAWILSRRGPAGNALPKS